MVGFVGFAREHHRHGGVEPGLGHGILERFHRVGSNPDAALDSAEVVLPQPPPKLNPSAACLLREIEDQQAPLSVPVAIPRPVRMATARQGVMSQLGKTQEVPALAGSVLKQASFPEPPHIVQPGPRFLDPSFHPGGVLVARVGSQGQVTGEQEQGLIARIADGVGEQRFHT